MKKAREGPSKEQMQKESEELLEKISGQRIKLKNMRGGDSAEGKKE